MQTRQTLRAVLDSPLSLSGAALTLLFVLMALIGPMLAPYSPEAQDLLDRFAPPSALHWFGTDEFGRDIFSRILHGARVTLQIVVLVVVTAAPVGVAVGCIAGYFGGAVDAIMMRVTDVVLSLPRLILALALVSVLGAGLGNAVLAIALTAWAPYARIARAETLSIRRADFISAARLQGFSAARIIVGQVLILAVPPVVVRLSLDMASYILAAAGLGFLGLGVQPPAAEWGAMISSGRSYMFDYWWVATFPGIAILIVCMAFNLLGDGLRDILDPKRR